ALAEGYEGEGAGAGGDGNIGFEGKIGTYKTRFISAMDSDFNTPLALAELFNISREINTHVEARDVPKESMDHAAEVLAELAGAMGISLEKKTDLKKIGEKLRNVCGDFGVKFTNPEEVLEKLIGLRNEARKKKEFGKSDSIRATLAEIGVILEKSDSIRATLAEIGLILEYKKEGVRWKI
ncbi:MAG: hypothetical protein NT157_05685, partial [Candidatus Micrarchaeota archaeon]|nr:hypothetical protein [Candidatus Micrarchaeota archaeon]